jgi:23S rRNA pseudouridine1911/1915/1917 synthase
MTAIADRILYQDNHLIIINKMPSEITQGDKTGDEPMGEAVKLYLKETYQKPGNVFLGVVHRLDRPVSGAVVFAKTSKALARMNEMQQKREIRKVYWAVCPHPVPPPIGGGSKRGGWLNLSSYLKKNEQQNKSYVYDGPGPGRLLAELKYRKIASSDRYDLLEVELVTGRHHQIRAQLAHAGMPIKGDLKYGAPRSNPDGSIHLHSRQVEFIHPVSKILVSVTAPVPEEKVWMIFEKMLT